MIHPRDVAEFEKRCGELVALMKRIRKYNPEAEIFMEAEAGLMLFDGDSRGEHGLAWDRQRGSSHWTPGFGCGAN